MTAPRHFNAILAFGAAAVGPEPDAIGHIIFGVSVYNTESPPLTLLEWEIEQLSAATLGRWVPKIYNRIEELSGATSAMAGGLTVDPSGIGRIVYEQASAVYPVDLVRNERILEMTMPQRAVAASAFVYSEFVVLAPEARKSTTYKGKTANHLTRQVGAFGVDTKPDAAGVLLVAFANGVLEIFDSEAMRRRTRRMVHVESRPVEPAPPMRQTWTGAWMAVKGAAAKVFGPDEPPPAPARPLAGTYLRPGRHAIRHLATRKLQVIEVPRTEGADTAFVELPRGQYEIDGVLFNNFPNPGGPLGPGEVA